MSDTKDGRVGNHCAGSGDFAIGSAFWPGVSKLIEECGEVVQVCGKLLGTHGQIDHWDGSNLRSRLSSELGDLTAAIAFVRMCCDLDDNAISARTRQKMDLFFNWHRNASNLPAAGRRHRPDATAQPLPKASQ